MRQIVFLAVPPDKAKLWNTLPLIAPDPTNKLDWANKLDGSLSAPIVAEMLATLQNIAGNITQITFVLPDAFNQADSLQPGDQARDKAVSIADFLAFKNLMAHYLKIFSEQFANIKLELVAGLSVYRELWEPSLSCQLEELSQQNLIDPVDALEEQLVLYKKYLKSDLMSHIDPKVLRAYCGQVKKAQEELLHHELNKEFFFCNTHVLQLAYLNGAECYPALVSPKALPQFAKQKHFDPTIGDYDYLWLRETDIQRQGSRAPGSPEECYLWDVPDLKNVLGARNSADVVIMCSEALLDRFAEFVKKVTGDKEPSTLIIISTGLDPDHAANAMNEWAQRFRGNAVFFAASQIPMVMQTSEQQTVLQCLETDFATKLRERKLLATALEKSSQAPRDCIPKPEAYLIYPLLFRPYTLPHIILQITCPDAYIRWLAQDRNDLFLSYMSERLRLVEFNYHLLKGIAKYEQFQGLIENLINLTKDLFNEAHFGPQLSLIMVADQLTVLYKFMTNVISYVALNNSDLLKSQDQFLKYYRTAIQYIESLVNDVLTRLADVSFWPDQTSPELIDFQNSLETAIASHKAEYARCLGIVEQVPHEIGEATKRLPNKTVAKQPVPSPKRNKDNDFSNSAGAARASAIRTTRFGNKPSISTLFATTRTGRKGLEEEIPLDDDNSTQNPFVTLRQLYTDFFARRRASAKTPAMKIVRQQQAGSCTRGIKRFD